MSLSYDARSVFSLFSMKYMGSCPLNWNFCVWGKAHQRATQATPHPTASRIRGVYTWRERDFRTRTRNPGAELRRGEKGGGENNAKLNNSRTEWYFGAIFYTKIDIPFLLLIALTNCAHLLLASLASKNLVLCTVGAESLCRAESLCCNTCISYFRHLDWDRNLIFSQLTICVS